MRHTWNILIVTAALIAARPAAGQVVSSVVSSPPTVIGGAPFTMIINIAGANPFVPVVVQVYSHETGAAPWAGDLVTIPSNTPSFPLVRPTLAVSQDTVVPYSVVQISPGSTVVRGQVTVQTPRVSSMSFVPSFGQGGQTLVGTLQLSGLAPSDGAPVTLTSDNPAIVSVPASIVVLPGAQSASFDAVLSPVSGTTNVPVRATRASATVSQTVVVAAPRLNSLVVYSESDTVPPTCTGGFIVEGEIGLDSPAPVGGLSVRLTSSVSAAAGVPATVTVPFGATSVRFDVTTAPVLTVTPTTLTASQGNDSRQAQLNVLPSYLSGLVFAPAGIAGGRPTTGTVHLTGIAPPGGVTVQLLDSSPSVTIPANVMVPAGQTMVNFQATTARVIQAVNVPITARLGTQDVTTDLSVLLAELGDADGDGDIDNIDKNSLLPCWRGPTVSSDPFCQAIFGFKPGEATDLADFAGFQAAFTGARSPATIPPPWTEIDANLEPEYDTIPGLDGVTPRPVAAAADDAGNQAEFVQDEIVIVTDDANALNAFIDRWQGQEIWTYRPADYQLDGQSQHLIRVNTDLADTSGLDKNLAFIDPQARGRLRVSNDAGLKLLAIAADAAANGLSVGVNWIGRASSFRTRSTTDAPSGPGGYDPNAFNWPFMNAGSTQDIGVTEAWRALDLAGKLGNRVKIAVLDMGFQSNADFPSSQTYISNVPFVVDPRGVENLLSCGGGSDCPWHGSNVVQSAMGRADNSFGAAGPAGPIAQAVCVFTLYDFVTGITAVVEARAAGAKIINMSYGARVPAIVSFTVLPFELATVSVRASGALLFASAGNDGANVDAEDCFIACWEEAWHTPCENAGVTCVGGIRWDSKYRAPNSNYGGEHVDIFAPYTIWTGPDPSDGGANIAKTINGTSFSSPYTAGVAALIWAANPGLSSNSVLDILYDTAHSSPDSRVDRYVNAYEAVVSALGSAPPDLDINSPGDGLTFSRGLPITFVARAADREDGVPSIVWTSNRETPSQIGTGTAFSRSDLRLGTHVITASATDTSGINVRDTVTITVRNDPPSVNILEPVNNMTVCAGETFPLRATSFDLNNPPFYRLLDPSMAWRSNRDGALGSGDEISTFLATTGAHIITLTGTDDQGSAATDTVAVNVQAIPCDSISVAITQPSADVPNGNVDYAYDGFDNTRNMWYTDVTLRGRGFDPQEGLLTGASLVWTTDRTALQPALLGTGEQITVRLYSNRCEGTTHTITLTVTDSDGNSRARVRRIAIWTIC